MVNICLVMLIAINVPFFLAMHSSTPCETAIGGCNTISCVCANYLLATLFMLFVCLLYTSLLLVRMLRGGEGAAARVCLSFWTSMIGWPHSARGHS